MKKLYLAVFFLFMTSVCFSQVVQSPQYNNTGKTNIGHLGVQGLDVDGNPGYIELKSTSTLSGTDYWYYLWIDETGDLCLASYTTISAYTSFPDGDWKLDNMNAACTKVGGQS